MTDPPLVHPGSAGTPARLGGPRPPAPTAGGRLSSLTSSWEPNLPLLPLPSGCLGPCSSSYTVLWPSQGKNVASYLQIEKHEDFRAVPAKSLAEHWAQCGWTGPHKLMGLSPGLSLSFFKSPGLGPSALGKQGRGVGWTAAGRPGPQVSLQTRSQAPGIWPPQSQSSLAERRLGSSVLRNNPLHRSGGSPGWAGDPGSAAAASPRALGNSGSSLLALKPRDLRVQRACQAGSGHLDFRVDVLWASRPWGAQDRCSPGLKFCPKEVLHCCAFQAKAQ